MRERECVSERGRGVWGYYNDNNNMTVVWARRGYYTDCGGGVCEKEKDVYGVTIMIIII